MVAESDFIISIINVCLSWWCTCKHACHECFMCAMVYDARICVSSCSQIALCGQMNHHCPKFNCPCEKCTAFEEMKKINCFVTSLLFHFLPLIIFLSLSRKWWRTIMESRVSIRFLLLKWTFKLGLAKRKVGFLCRNQGSSS